MALFVPRTVSGLLVDQLRDDIVRGSFEPGERLLLEELASRFTVSTMPVREALRELEAEGLVTIYPHRGAVVTELTPEDLLDIYDIRATLEARATRLAAPCLTEAICAELATIIDDMDQNIGEVAALVKLNHEFHSILYAASGRKHLCDVIRTFRLRTRHYLHAYIADLGGMPVAQNEHREILACCTRCDAESASQLVHDHVWDVGCAIIDFVKKTPPSVGF